MAPYWRFTFVRFRSETFTRRRSASARWRLCARPARRTAVRSFLIVRAACFDCFSSLFRAPVDWKHVIACVFRVAVRRASSATVSEIFGHLPASARTTAEAGRRRLSTGRRRTRSTPPRC